MQESMMMNKSNVIQPDPYAASVIMDLSAYSGAIVDAKGNVMTNTNVQVVNTQKKWGPYSMYFNGTGYLQTPNSAGNLWLPGNFTIEAWLYLNARITQYPCLYNNYSSWPNANALGVFLGHQQRPTTYSIAAVGTFPSSECATALLTGQWCHYAVVRNSGGITAWLNGQSIMTTTFNTTASLFGTKDKITIGDSADTMSNAQLNAYIERYRITNVARYTAPFTPQRF